MPRRQARTKMPKRKASKSKSIKAQRNLAQIVYVTSRRSL